MLCNRYQERRRWTSIYRRDLFWILILLTLTSWSKPCQSLDLNTFFAPNKKRNLNTVILIDSRLENEKKISDLDLAKTRAGFTKSSSSAKNDMKPIFFIWPSFLSRQIHPEKSVWGCLSWQKKFTRPSPFQIKFY